MPDKRMKRGEESLFRPPASTKCVVEMLLMACCTEIEPFGVWCNGHTKNVLTKKNAAACGNTIIWPRP